MAKQKIFFSYSRADGSAFALRLAVDLKQKGFDVWMDQEDIRAGSEWDIEIEKALETCDCLLFIETERSVVSNNVLDEVYYALDENKKVIPVIHVDSKTPFRLKRLQHIDFTRDYNTGLSLLVNELEGNSTTITYVTEKTKPEAIVATPQKTKFTGLPFVVGSVVILLAAVVFFFTFKNNNDKNATAKEAVVVKDTTSNKVTGPVEQPDTLIANVPVVDNSLEGSTTANKKQKKIASKTIVGKLTTQRPASTILQSNTTNASETSVSNLSELYAGDWRLVSVEPKAQSHRGYLKIEALDGGKANIKSYMQFYYPESKTSSYLTVFNAFANCNSCVLKTDVKLIAEDVAVGSRTIKTLKEDQPDGGKAGDVVLDANSNKSINASVTLHFIDATTAVIKIQQLQTIALAHELMLEPFVYTFRFKKSD